MRYLRLEECSFYGPLPSSMKDWPLKEMSVWANKLDLFTVEERGKPSVLNDHTRDCLMPLRANIVTMALTGDQVSGPGWLADRQPARKVLPYIMPEYHRKMSVRRPAYPRGFYTRMQEVTPPNVAYFNPRLKDKF